MSAKITFFPVCNGDMTLIKFADKDETTLLIDIKIRENTNEFPNVIDDLRRRLRKDEKDRPYVDAFLLSHPDEDHCLGLTKNFYLGDPDKYPDDEKDEKEKRIIIKEMWSSPIVFRRSSKNHNLCDDAKAWAKEARRRVQVNKDQNFKTYAGDRIIVLGEDIIEENTQRPKTDKILQIVRKCGETFKRINDKELNFVEFFLLAPVSLQDEETEELLSKNESSVIMNIKISDNKSGESAIHFLTGGDAGVAIWEKIWDKYGEDEIALKYDLLQTPHHCSWRSLSYESWKDTQGKAKPSDKALKALGQINNNGTIVASSKSIVDDYNDPPNIGAKKEYKKITDKCGGKFYCTGEYPNKNEILKPLEFEVNSTGLCESSLQTSTSSKIVIPRPHKFGT